MQWYYVRDGERQGPVEEEELKRIVDRGEIPRDALIWRSGLSDWERYSSLFGQKADDQDLTPSTPTEAKRVCAGCNKEFPDSEVTLHNGQLVCDSCREASLNDLQRTRPRPSPSPRPQSIPQTQSSVNGLALAGLILGIIGLIPCFTVFAMVGLGLSIGGLVSARKTGVGRGMAIAGIVCSLIGLLEMLLFIAFVALAPAAEGL